MAINTIRLQSDEIEPLRQAAFHVLTTWKDYSDEEVDIREFSKDTPHNTITPIARMRANKVDFDFDFVLRNNRKSEEHPLGTSHPYADIRHIKKDLGITFAKVLTDTDVLKVQSECEPIIKTLNR